MTIGRFWIFCLALAAASPARADLVYDIDEMSIEAFEKGMRERNAAAPGHEPRFIDRCFDGTGPRPEKWQHGETGLWQPVAASGDDLQDIARNIGRLTSCFMAPDGLPREILRGDIGDFIASTAEEDCAAILVPGNRLIAIGPCLPDRYMTEAGIEAVRMRVTFGPFGPDDPTHPLIFDVESTPIKTDPATGAALMAILGDAEMAIGGLGPDRFGAVGNPGAPLVALHYPVDGPLSATLKNCRVVEDEYEHRDHETEFVNSCRVDIPTSGGAILDAETHRLVGLQIIWRADLLFVAQAINPVLRALAPDMLAEE